MTKKRILFIHHGQGIGGAPHSLRLLILSLNKNEFEPIVLFLFDSPAVQLFIDAGIAVAGPVLRTEFSHTVIWWYRWYHVHHLLKAVWDWCAVLFFDARHWFAKFQPDVVHLNTSSLSAWAIVAWWLNLPVVWHVRESLAPGYCGIRQKIVQWLVGRFATTIIAISQYDGRFWQGSKKLLILPNPVDCAVFAPSVVNRKKMRQRLQISEDAKVLVYLGGLSREKGALLALQVLECVLQRRKNVFLVIAGSWQMPNTSTFRKIIGVQQWYDQVDALAKKLHRNIRFVGVVSSAHEILQMGDCLLFPAQKGHFARPVLEAGAVGVPVVASDLAPLDELVLPGKTGFLCSPGCVAAWVVALKDVFTASPDTFLPACEWVQESFGSQRYGEKITQVYQKITT